MNKSLIIGSLFVVTLIASCSKEKADEIVVDTNTAEVLSDTISFSTDIAPLLSNQCTFSGCHFNGSGLGDYTSYSGIKIDSDNGKLHNRVVSLMNMPIGSGSLNDSERTKINSWISQGALNN